MNGSSRPTRLPAVVYALAACTFLMLTSEFVVAGLLPEIAGDLGVGVGRAGLLITVFAVGMVVGAPTTALLARRQPRRRVLVLALAVFAVGHVVVALGHGLPVLLAARFVTAWATGAFWSVAFVVAGRAAGPAASSRALGVVTAGGMLANVAGVPLGAFAGQAAGWRGPFWALAVLASGAVALVLRSVPHEQDEDAPSSVRSQLSALRSRQLWLALAACATTSGGVLAAYSYVSPLLTDRAGLARALVPLVLVAFGVATLGGALVGGRLGDRHPYPTVVGVPLLTTGALAGVTVLSTHPVAVVGLLVLLGTVGLSANAVLTDLAVRAAPAAQTLASALAVAAFNAGTAVSTPIAARTLGTGLHEAGPALVGTAIAACTLVPATCLALTHRRRGAGPTRTPARALAPTAA